MMRQVGIKLNFKFKTRLIIRFKGQETMQMSRLKEILLIKMILTQKMMNYNLNLAHRGR